ncbi:hypothetical protein IRT45_35460 [Nocardia sp. BSTN01]|uniref:hypothetical protein n=1 Tax=Nocardia sp. BSTN01 TaxID=2783665 RepID=UPI00188FDB8A|nr:hypothetical protein [Nocardia sp. BSTN01]MBF5002417.1 hypothetical protein [Nocardia sp. BSTN01]
MTAVEPARTPLTIDDYELDKALDAAATAYTNALAPDLPPLAWSHRYESGRRRPVLSGQVAYFTYPGRFVEVAQQWAERLGLAESEDTLPGQRMWFGAALGRFGDVRVWCIVDRAAWDRAGER